MQILSVHLDFPHLTLTRIRKNRKKVDILWTKTFTEDFSNVKPLYIKNFKGKLVSGLAANNFLIRQLDTKLAKVEEAIVFQSEALSHFQPNEVLTIPMIKKGLILTIPRENLKSHLGKLQALEIDPDIVSTTPTALCHFVRWKFPDISDALIVDLGSNEIVSVLMEKRNLKKAHAIPAGVEDLLKALYEDRKRTLLKKEIDEAAQQIDLLLLKPQLNPRLSNSLSAFKQELAKIQYAFSPNQELPIIFTGRADAFIHFTKYLSEQAPIPLSIEEQKSAVSLGLCLELAAKESPQLRKEEFFPQKNWAKMGKIALSLLFASLLISFTMITLGIRSIDCIKTKMLGSVDTNVDDWIASIEENNKEFPYILQVPKVSEILAWLSSNPLLEELKREGDPIDIKEIHTELIHFPSLDAEKVDLEFSFKNTRNARRFHEMLRGDNEFIDREQEITWSALNDSYTTSFYLKTRQAYVP